MAKLKITRTSEWHNRMREIGIYLDWQKLGTIANGETKEFDIPAGNHKLKAKIDWCGSRELILSVSDHETKNVTLSGFKQGYSPLYYMTIGRNDYLVIKEG